MSLALASLLAAPGQAVTPMDRVDFRAGGFVGARLRLPLGQGAEERPLVGLAVAPTLSRVSSDGRVQTTVGEGLALNFGRQMKPTVTLAGRPAGEAIGLKSEGKAATGQKLGISTVGWVAIGVGAAILVGGAILVAPWIKCKTDSDVECGSE
jgi:hypothetical protein